MCLALVTALLLFESTGTICLRSAVAFPVTPPRSSCCSRCVPPLRAMLTPTSPTTLHASRRAHCGHHGRSACARELDDGCQVHSRRPCRSRLSTAAPSLRPRQDDPARALWVDAAAHRGCASRLRMGMLPYTTAKSRLRNQHQADQDNTLVGQRKDAL